MTYNLTTRLSAAGEGFLWCVSVVGPDDIFPVRSYAAAVAMSEAMNARFIDTMERTDVATIAIPAIWPWDAEAHAEILASEGEKG